MTSHYIAILQYNADYSVNECLAEYVRTAIGISQQLKADIVINAANHEELH